MTTAAVKPIPEGMHSVTPHLICAGAADAIEFYKQAFNATEQSRLPGPGGKLMHASIRIGDSTVMLVDENPQYGALGPKALKGSPVVIHLYVPDVDAFAAQAVAAGAKITMPVNRHSRRCAARSGASAGRMRINQNNRRGEMPCGAWFSSRRARIPKTASCQPQNC